MKRFRAQELSLRGLLMVLATALVFSPAQVAFASSCFNPKIVHIQFPRGGRCWRYRGDATEFWGTFRAGQTVTATSTGMADETTSQRDVYVSGPHNFSASANDDGELRTRLPLSGLYKFGFSPCAMWHYPGTFVVCTD